MENLTVKEQEFVTEAFLKHGSLVKQIARKFANGDSRLEATDIESYLTEKFITVALKYDPSKMSNLGAYLNSTLTRHAINYTKSAEATSTKVNTPFSTFDSDENGEDDAPSFEETRLTDGILFADDLERVEHITSTLDKLFAQATPLQADIMRAYLTIEGKASYTQIGKMVGKHHETVKRELKKLAQLTDFDFTVLQ